MAQLTNDSINNTVSDSDSDGTNDLTASIMYNGSDYVLVFESKSRSAANAIRVTASDASSSTLSNAFEYNTSDKTLTQSVSAADASFTVDGISMTRSNNTITDLYEGYTLQLLATQFKCNYYKCIRKYYYFGRLCMQDFVDSYNIPYIPQFVDLHKMVPMIYTGIDTSRCSFIRYCK